MVPAFYSEAPGSKYQPGVGLSLRTVARIITPSETSKLLLGFEVFTAVTMKITGFLDVVQCGFIINRTFRRNVSPPSSG
jgi:hypothetical protein